MGIVTHFSKVAIRSARRALLCRSESSDLNNMEIIVKEGWTAVENGKNGVGEALPSGRRVAYMWARLRLELRQSAVGDRASSVTDTCSAPRWQQLSNDKVYGWHVEGEIR